ncbi:replication initiator protein [Capybara microvirus Cap1_SP_222]|nr:replication initiator protein [Capybara microvirus Cap1_SP_222]
MICQSPIHLRDGPIRFVPCGKCANCLKRKHLEWQFRLQREERVSKCCYCVTLTYNDEKVPIEWTSKNEGGNLIFTLCKSDVQAWLKRIRHYLPKFRYYLVGEYGTKTFRPHYHVILFFSDFIDIQRVFDVTFKYWYNSDIEGHKVDIVSPQAINYCSKYVQKLMSLPSWLDCQQPFALMSRKPGIGDCFIRNEATATEILSNYRSQVYFDEGHKVSLPRFYRDKLFTDNLEKQIFRDRCKSYLVKFNNVNFANYVCKYGFHQACKFFSDMPKNDLQKLIRFFKNKQKL